MDCLFGKYVDANGEDFYLHHRAYQEIKDPDIPVFVNRNDAPEPGQSTTHTREFEDVFEDCLLYARLTLYKDPDFDKSHYYGTIRGNTIPVYLGLGVLEDIKSRAEDFKYFKTNSEQLEELVV